MFPSSLYDIVDQNWNKNFRFEANLTTKRTVNASCLWLDCVIGQYTSCTHVVVAHFLESTLLLLFFSFIFVNIYFRPTLGSPSFICPSFRFVTHIALSWLSFNNNNTYIAPISKFLFSSALERTVWVQFPLSPRLEASPTTTRQD